MVGIANHAKSMKHIIHSVDGVQVPKLEVKLRDFVGAGPRHHLGLLVEHVTGKYAVPMWFLPRD